MYNLYEPQSAKIVFINKQTDSVKLFRFEFEKKVSGHRFLPKPGQIIELSISGFGEAPFAPCGSQDNNHLELCIRKVGRLTEKLHSMKVGDRVGIRGAYGNGWPVIANNRLPIEKKNLLIVVGGLGLIPLRTLILEKDKFLGKESKLQIFYGAKKPEEMLFRHEYSRWQEKGIEVNLTVDKECANWQGCVGLVTALFDKFPICEDCSVFVCGPPVMYKSIIEKLIEKGIDENDIFLSLERRMHCGVGICQHCAVGPYYVCKNGPVFGLIQLKDIPGAI